MVQIVVAGDIVDHYCLIFDRGAVHIVVAGYVIDNKYFRVDRGVVHIVVAGDIVDHYCLMFHKRRSILLWLLYCCPLMFDV